MNEWLTHLGLPCVSTFQNIAEAVEAVNAQRVKFPLIIKPRMGTGSISTYRVDDEQELRVFYKRAQKEIEASSVSHESGFTSSQALIIQEFILGKEYNLNVINDLNGSYKSTIVTEKLSVRSGEMDIAVTRNIPDLETLGRKIGNVLGHPYLLDIDVVIRDGITYMLDMNPRISGSYPFGRMAGVNFAEILIRWLEDQNADVSSYLTPLSNVITMKGISMHIAQFQ